MMMHFKIKLLRGILILSFFGFGVYIKTQLANGKISGGGEAPTVPRLIGDLAINCGSVGNSTALDGREWVGELASEFTSSESRSSIAVQTSSPGAAIQVPYKTSRISATEFRYTFQVNQGQKIVRLHFYPASYQGFEKGIDYFSVKAGTFTVLRDYSASLAAHTLGLEYIVKEFCLNVEEENPQLTITFSPSSIEKSKKKIYAFVNGIEIISAPTGLYYTPEHELGARIVGLNNGFYSIENSTALEVIQRLNIGGNSINPMEDVAMFRQWNEDASYLLEPRAHRVSHVALKYKNIPAFVVPPKIYRTSWKIDIGVSQMYYNFTWKVPVDLGFGYLVRLHFCELDYRMAEREPREFSVLINNEVAETKSDVIRWSGDVGIPVYRDYLVIMEGGREGSKSDLFIGLQSVDELVLGLLKGLEIFKLSNLENNLAAPDLVFPKELSTSWNLKIEIFSLAFNQSNVIGTVMTVLIILLSIATYNLRNIWEENVHEEKSSESALVELSYRCFSYADIQLATQNFSEAFVIGKGGFGKVYRGFIPGVPDAVAIKRLNSYSKQGAPEFWTEIKTLSKLRHIQLVSLIGYCNECLEMILVYEYIPGGTLADNLYKFARKGEDCSPLSWEQRLRICTGAARGLEYLHTSSKYGVIHRDVKDTNILLDENFVAKISDFGLSKLEKVTKSKSYVSTNVRGTVGYLDPDYFRTHRLTRKSDVYSFGIVMLVVLSGKPAVDTGNPGEPESVLSRFRKCMAHGDVSRIIDPRLHGEISSNNLRRFLKIVENCLHELPKRRPTMALVVSSLEQALERHQSHMSSILEDTTVPGHPCKERNSQSLHLSPHEANIPEGVVISPLAEVNTGKQTQNLASTTRGENLRSRGKVSGLLRKAVDSTKQSWAKILRKDGSKLPSNPQKVEHLQHRLAANSLTAFTLDEIMTIAENFSQDYRLGVGGFGHVYKGFLPEDVKKGLHPIPVAIKVLDSFSLQGHSEWLAEVTFLGQLSHPNLVKLIGYCCEDQDRMLIYEFMAGGSVDKSLFPRDSRLRRLSWSTRIKIAFGAAKGLAFLHELERPVIYRDFKTSNILLDLDYNAKLSDFGLAKDGPTDDRSHVTTRVMGTDGYAAPEYVATGHLTPKSDVYSYGVVLLELLTGRRSLDRNRPLGEQQLTNWAMPLLREKRKLLRIVDPSLEGDYPMKDLQKVATLAYSCLNLDPKARPSTRGIVDSLEPLRERSKELAR